ncbi:MAG TPA: universal stress protein [Acidimicrobiales bacterium]|nr:universal stress protein [Acidimicrobiales bacterium]
MRIVLAALDGSPAARPVIETAVRVGQMTDAGVEAVHVADGLAVTPRLLAERAGVPLRLLPGPVLSSLVAAVDDPVVAVAVLGARDTPGGPRPVGSTTLGVVGMTRKPVVVVPPEAVGGGPLRRLLVPLEGTEASSRAVVEGLCPMLVGDVELIVLHVFTDDTLPRMLDRPGDDLELLGRQFIERNCPTASGIELRPGPVAQRVHEVSDERHADLVVLSWSQDSSLGHGRVVHEVLGRSTIPVLLLAGGPLVPDDGPDSVARDPLGAPR